jgi:hypothetical protein
MDPLQKLSCTSHTHSIHSKQQGLQAMLYIALQLKANIHQPHAGKIQSFVYLFSAVGRQSYSPVPSLSKTLNQRHLCLNRRALYNSLAAMNQLNAEWTGVRRLRSVHHP